MSFSLLYLIFNSFFFPFGNGHISSATMDSINNSSNVFKERNSFQTVSNHTLLKSELSKKDTIYISGNMSIDDSLTLFNGYIVLDGDLNINTAGVLNVSNNAFLYVKKDINLNGKLFGAKNVKTDGIFYKYIDSQVFSEPILEIN